MTCPLCSPTNYVISRSEFWTTVLNEDQGFLGRCYFALNRHETDVTRLLPSELSSLWDQMRIVKGGLDQLWSPDHYNYVFLMNVQPHLHGHIIPRYSAQRVLDGHVFVDGNLGSHYSLTNINLPPPDVLTRIARSIRIVVGAPEELS